MWYFAWILGVGFALLLAVVNALWYEAQEDRKMLMNAEEEAAGQHAKRAA
jgi:cyd operon protein YbgT